MSIEFESPCTEKSREKSHEKTLSGKNRDGSIFRGLEGTTNRTVPFIHTCTVNFSLENVGQIHIEPCYFPYLPL